MQNSVPVSSGHNSLFKSVKYVLEKTPRLSEYNEEYQHTWTGTGNLRKDMKEERTGLLANLENLSRVWKCCSNNEIRNRTGGARGGEVHSARGMLVAQDPDDPCSQQMYQVIGFWERDWCRLIITTWFKTKIPPPPPKKKVLIVRWKTNYHLGRTCVLLAAESAYPPCPTPMFR